jgi:hypothetical protein
MGGRLTRRAKLKALERQLQAMFQRFADQTPAHLVETLERLEEQPTSPRVELA